MKYPTESISYNIVADEEGNIYLPVGGYNRSSSSRNATYNWMVSIDDGTPVNYSGTGSAGGSITFSGYQVGSEHSITITPVAKAYGWALAYGWYETAGAPYLTRVNYDGSYVGYGSSATDTGSYFRYSQYRGCSSLVIAPNEVLPNTVTSIGTNFRVYQYYGCVSLVSVPDEVLPNGVTSIGNSFRLGQYRGCTSLVSIPDEVMPSGITSIGGDFRREQYYSCKSLIIAPNEVMPNSLTSIGNQFRYGQYQGCSSLVTAPDEVLPSGITSIGNNFRQNQYYGCTSLVSAPDEALPSLVTTIGYNFRNSQYRGCSSLVNAPDEVLPSSVTSIGTYFRYYQYYGCTSLVTAPNEALPNTVISVGNNFRNGQYQNCTSLTSAKLIANNTVDTSNKRYLQFSGAGNTTNPMVITIYGNEMEADMATNSCSLANNRVAAIYVQPNLVEQYQQAAIRSNIDDVKFGPIEEIIYKMNADDSGNLYVPVGGYNRSASSRNATYNWNVAVDGDNATNYNGTGSAGGSITLSGYVPGTNHTIKIIPTNATYGWALAYGWYETVGAPYLTEVFYDGSYVGYGSSATSAGNYFKESQYRGCTSLVTAPDEALPGSVTGVGDNFRAYQYRGCTSLVNAPDEVLPSGVTSIGSHFRSNQYYGCTSLVTAPDEVLPSGVTSIGVSFRGYQYRGCTSLVNAPDEVISNAITIINSGFREGQYQLCSLLVSAPDEVSPNTVTSIGGSFRYSQYESCTSLIAAPNEVIPDTVTTIGGLFRQYQYRHCSSLITAADEAMSSNITAVDYQFRTEQYSGCSSLTSAKLIANNTVSTTRKRNNQFNNAGNTTTPMTITISGSEVELDMATNSCSLDNGRVATIYVPSALVQGYQEAEIWSNITDSKFVGY